VRWYQPRILPAVVEQIRRLPPDLKRGIREVIRAIADDPGRGEPLERELEGYLKYKVRRFRIVYRVDRAKRIVQVLAVGLRRSIYEEVAEQIRRR